MMDKHDEQAQRWLDKQVSVLIKAPRQRPVKGNNDGEKDKDKNPRKKKTE